MEIGICLLIDESSTCKINKIIEPLISSLPALSNHLHISLYQLRIETDRLQECVERLSALNFSIISFEANKLENKYDNLICPFNLLNKNTSYGHLVQTVVDHFGSLRSSQLMEQIDVSTLDAYQRELVEQYGIYWNMPPANSEPYSTLLYNYEYIDIDKLPFESFNIQCTELALVRLGVLGNAEDIITKVKLND